jgi:2-polyprenyl-6-methoxyphenol hydroxylase-like FAD-dependent oxidoreductase
MQVKKVAIIGAGSAGLIQAIALHSKFGDGVDVHVFERDEGFSYKRGVELEISPPVQIVLLALGFPEFSEKLANIGYAHFGVSVTDCMGNHLVEVEKVLNEKVVIDESCKVLKNGNISQIPYSLSRTAYQEILFDILQTASKGRGKFHWGYKLMKISSMEDEKKKLEFENGSVEEGFDLVIGADGIHSKVRKLLFDDHNAVHVGSNILYGIIDRKVDILHDDLFNIICCEKFTTVASFMKGPTGDLITWWAIVHPDFENDNKFSPSEYRTFWESQTDVQAVAQKLIESDPEGSRTRQLVELTTSFRYSGQFLERDPDSLEKWGLGNVVLIGDAAHGMQPWAGAGASMAAEDAFVLTEMIDKYGFGVENLQKAFDECQSIRKNRIQFFKQTTNLNTPKGILRLECNFSVEDLINTYGDQRILEASPVWEKLVKMENNSNQLIK